MSCEIKLSTEKKRAWLGQPHLIKNLEKKIGKLVKHVCSHKTTGMPKFLIIRFMVENNTIDAEDQEEYWVGVDILLYLVKHLHSNLTNATRILLKANNDVKPAAYWDLLHVIKYVLDTKNHASKLNLQGILKTNGKLFLSAKVIMQETQ